MPAERIPLVSVVMPTHNRAALLPRAVAAVMAQGFTDWELVVVDDGSRDETPEVLARIAAADPRVRVERNETPGGAARARNHGISVARGEWVAFLDDDDEWLPTKLERQVAAAAARPGAGLVYCPYRYLWPDGRSHVIGAYDPDEAPGPRIMIFRSCFVITSSVLARRDLLLRTGGFDPALPPIEDWDLWIRLAQITDFAWVPDALVLLHATPDSLSSDPGRIWNAGRILLEKISGLEGVGRRERANVMYSLGHDLVRRRWRREGLSLLFRSLALRPWPPQRLAMVSAALLGTRAHRLALDSMWTLYAWAWRRRLRDGGGDPPAPGGAGRAPTEVGA